MSSLPIEGRVSARPTVPEYRHGRVSGSAPRTGSVSGSAPRTGRVSAEVADPNRATAAAEVNTLISSLGSLSAQAQTLPLTPPTLPQLPQGGYQPQPTDYTQFANDN